MMLHQKTEKTLVEISRKLENPAVKGPALQVKVPPKQVLLDMDYGHHHLLTGFYAHEMPMSYNSLSANTRHSKDNFCVIEKLPFCSNNPQMVF